MTHPSVGQPTPTRANRSVYFGKLCRIDRRARARARSLLSSPLTVSPLNNAPHELRCWIEIAPLFSSQVGCLSAARVHQCVTARGHAARFFGHGHGHVYGGSEILSEIRASPCPRSSARARAASVRGPRVPGGSVVPHPHRSRPRRARERWGHSESRRDRAAKVAVFRSRTRRTPQARPT